MSKRAANIFMIVLVFIVFSTLPILTGCGKEVDPECKGFPLAAWERPPADHPARIRWDETIPYWPENCKRLTLNVRVHEEKPYDLCFNWDCPAPTTTTSTTIPTPETLPPAIQPLVSDPNKPELEVKDKDGKVLLEVDSAKGADVECAKTGEMCTGPLRPCCEKTDFCPGEGDDKDHCIPKPTDWVEPKSD